MSIICNFRRTLILFLCQKEAENLEASPIPLSQRALAYQPIHQEKVLYLSPLADQLFLRSPQQPTCI